MLPQRVRAAMVPAIIGGAAVATVAMVGGVAVISPETVGSTMHQVTSFIEGDSNATREGMADFYRRTFAEGNGSLMADFLIGPFGASPALEGEPTDDADATASSGSVATTAGRLTNPESAEPAGSPAGDAGYVLDGDLSRPKSGAETRTTDSAATAVTASATPASSGAAEVIDGRREFDLNGVTRAYLVDGVTLANAVLAHLNRRRGAGGQEPPVTAGVDPLTRPLRRAGGAAGQRVADDVAAAVRTSTVPRRQRGSDRAAEPAVERGPARAARDGVTR